MPVLPVSIEITRGEIRGICFKSGFAGRTYATPAFAPLKSEEKLEDQLIHFIKDKYPDTNLVYLNAPYENIFLRELVLPFTDKAKIKDILSYEIESVIPYRLEEVSYDFFTFTQTKETKVLVIGSPVEVILPIVSALNTAGISLGGIYAPPFSLYQFLREHGFTHGHFLFLSRYFAIFLGLSGDELPYMRILPLGYEQLITALARELNLELTLAIELFFRILGFSFFEIAERELLKHVKLSKREIQKIEQILQEYQKKFQREMQLIKQNWLPEETQRPFYFFCELENSLLLQSLFTIPNIEAFPFEKTPLALFDKRMLIPLAGTFSVTSKKGINLLQGKLKKEVKVKTSRKKHHIFIMAILSFIIFSVSFYLDFRYRDRFLREKEKELAKIFENYFRTPPATDNPMNEALSILEKERKKTEIFRKFFTGEKFSQTLVALHQAMPLGLGLEIESISYDGKTLDISASLPSFAALGELKDVLRKSGRFASVESMREKSMPSPQGNRIKFSLVIKPLEKSGVDNL